MPVPIYEETYRSWHGRLESRPRTWWIISRTGARLLWKRSMILLLLLAALPFLVRVGQIYAATRLAEYPQLADLVRDLQIDEAFFAGFVRGQTFLLVLMMVLSGAGLIANDRRFRALQIYFSKPVGFWDYVLGKFLTIGYYGGLITLAPGLLLFVLHLLLTRDSGFTADFWWIPFAVTGQSLLMLLTLGGIIIALSAALKGPRQAGILFFALIFITDLFREILARIPEVGLISPTAVLRQTNALLFGMEAPFEYSPWLGLAVVGVITALSILVLWLRVRPTEVVT